MISIAEKANDANIMLTEATVATMQAAGTASVTLIVIIAIQHAMVIIAGIIPTVDMAIPGFRSGIICTAIPCQR